MATYRTPGVYVEEKSTLPPSVAEVATAVPAFIGYTSVGPADTAAPSVARIATLLEFVTAFGGAQPATFKVTELADPAERCGGRADASHPSVLAVLRAEPLFS
jgi:phage tail sheath protein FI